MKIKFRIGGILIFFYIPPLDDVQKKLLIGIGVAIVVNLLLISGLGFFLKAEPVRTPMEEKFITLNLEDQEVLQRAKELFENPLANQQKPKDAKILSDRDSKSATKEVPTDMKNSQNVAVVGDPNEKVTDDSKTEKSQEDEFENGKTVVPFVKANSEKKSFFEALTGQAASSAGRDLGPMYELNTYKWEFAPYMLKWKNKMTTKWYEITSKINFSPYANLGQIMVYVKMDRQGKLLDSKIVSYTCDKSFVAPAYASVINSFPLDPLPSTFPEQMLETTWTISIIN